MIRVAAVGDVHLGERSAGSLRAGWAALADEADVFLVAGDLTRHGTAAEGRVAAGELASLGLPVIAVLGNHDHHGGAADVISAALVEAGVRVLEGNAEVVEVGGATLGVAGVKGFGGGFTGATGSEFGEQVMKDFIAYSRAESRRLDEALCSLRVAAKVVLTHYAPVTGTLVGERRELYPFLGSSYLEQVIDRHGALLAVHGHAHYGTEEGRTAGGVPVRNVAHHVIRRPYAVYSVDA
ncbi:MAG: metallophosphoesterase [Pseudonocardiales bacterium]